MYGKKQITFITHILFELLQQTCISDVISFVVKGFMKMEKLF